MFEVRQKVQDFLATQNPHRQQAVDRSPQLPEIATRQALHRLDSPESRERLHRHGLELSAAQCRLFHVILTQWREPVIGEETGRCIVEHRLSQGAVDGWFRSLSIVQDLGAQASMAQIVEALTEQFFERRATLLFVAIVCGMFSDELADEVYRQMLGHGDDLAEDPLAQEAVEAYLASRDARHLIDRVRS